MKKKRAWITIGIVAVLIAGGVYLITRSASGQAGSSQLLANLQTAKVTRTTLSISSRYRPIRATGRTYSWPRDSTTN